MTGERIIVPPADYALFQTLQEQVGTFDRPIITEAGDVGRWYNEDLPNSEMTIRGIVREATLERLGYHQEEDWITDEENIARSLNDNPNAKAILGEPDFIHYKWQSVSLRNLGSFADMQQKAGMGPFVDVEKGLVFFADEVQRLAQGLTVTTLHSSGLEMVGYLAERRETFKVIDGNLLRVRGTITD